MTGINREVVLEVMRIYVVSGKLSNGVTGMYVNILVGVRSKKGVFF